MEKLETIKLNDTEYTLTLNRESFLRIDRICDIQKSMEIVRRPLIEHLDEIDDDYNPLEDEINDETIDEEIELKDKVMAKLVTNSFFIWLYPKHQLKISQVKEIIQPYLSDEKKAEFIGSELTRLLDECIAIRDEYNKEQKNLKALANK